MQYLTRDEFERIVVSNYGEGSIVHEELDLRWIYHSRVIEILQEAAISSPDRILEVGTMGTQLVTGSHSLDFDEKWNFEGNNPTYWHDLRKVPWPIPDKQYDWVVAMRVFHHLYPMQAECFREARRIAKNVVIIVPAVAPQKADSDRGITPLQFFRWNGFSPPSSWEGVPYFGSLYTWSDSTSSLSRELFLSKALISETKRMVKRVLRRN